MSNVIDLPAGVLQVVDGALCLGAANGSVLALDEVQLEGKPRMPGATFARDFQLRAGEALE